MDTEGLLAGETWEDAGFDEDLFRGLEPFDGQPIITSTSAVFAEGAVASDAVDLQKELRAGTYLVYTINPDGTNSQLAQVGLDPLGSGNVAIATLDTVQTGINLIAASDGSGFIGLYGGRVKLPARADDPADDGTNGTMWFRTDLAEIRVWLGGTAYKGALVPV